VVLLRLTKQHYSKDDLGLADFFDDRHKRKMLKLAEIKPSDVFYDLGCGDASVLIFAVRESGLKKAVGYENNLRRHRAALENVKRMGLDNKITIKREHLYDADLRNANVIFDMLPEDEGDFHELYAKGIREKTRLIKHDLPLIGYLPDAIDHPFYRMTFPLTLAQTKEQWASVVLGKSHSTPDDLWHELYYYGYEKDYLRSEIRRMQRILARRIP